MEVYLGTSLISALFEKKRARGLAWIKHRPSKPGIAGSNPAESVHDEKMTSEGQILMVPILTSQFIHLLMRVLVDMQMNVSSIHLHRPRQVLNRLVY